MGTISTKVDSETFELLVVESSSQQQFPLHQAASTGNLEQVKSILENLTTESDSYVQDNAKMTPLHHAIKNEHTNSAAICKALIEKYKELQICKLIVNMPDAKQRTPLYYAALYRKPKLIDLLLQSEADPNVKDVNDFAPLHTCVNDNSKEAIDCVRALLSTVSTPNINSSVRCGIKRNRGNSMHIAAKSMAPAMLAFLLSKGIDHKMEDLKGYTPLMLAASAGNSKEALTCVKILLEKLSPEEINACNLEKQSAVIMAAKLSHKNILKDLLSKSETDIFIVDSKKRTALHWAVEAWSHVDSLACVKLIVESEQMSKAKLGKHLHLYEIKDINEESPLAIAIKHRSTRITQYLISAHPDYKMWLTDDVLRTIYKGLPEAIIPIMNQCFRNDPDNFENSNEEIDIEFGPIVGFSDLDNGKDGFRQETKFLRYVLDSSKNTQRTVLCHPLVQIYMDLKWKSFVKIVWLFVMFNLLWLLLYTTMVFEIYSPNCISVNSTSAYECSTLRSNATKHWADLKIFFSLGFVDCGKRSAKVCDFSQGTTRFIATLLYILNVILLGKEALQIKYNGVKKHFRNITNWAQLGVIIISFIISTPAWQLASLVRMWQVHFAAIGIFAAWVLSLREVGKFPKYSIYATILREVFRNCLIMFIFYLPLLIGFALCLRIFVPGKGQFQYLIYGIIKVVVMMTGELNFEDTFYTSEGQGPSLAPNAVMGQFVFLTLIFVTTIVLLNLLTGLAVYDVKSLIKKAETNRLSNELKQIFLYESMVLWVHRNIWGFEKIHTRLWLQNPNLTSTECTEPEPDPCFTSFKQSVKTHKYPQELKQHIRNLLVPLPLEDEDDGEFSLADHPTLSSRRSDTLQPTIRHSPADDPTLSRRRPCWF